MNEIEMTLERIELEEELNEIEPLTSGELNEMKLTLEGYLNGK